MLSQVHFLLTYNCSYECDHCFVYSGPFAGGTMTLDQVERVLTEAKKIKTMKSIYFEGGEPFLYYPLMQEGIRLAHQAGFEVGIVSNSYFATSDRDAELWLKPLAEAGLDTLSFSTDDFHGTDEAATAARRAVGAARKLGIDVGSICIDPPRVDSDSAKAQEKGEPVVGGDVLFKGRAADKLTAGLPTRDWKSFVECPHEELRKPIRVHVDTYGTTQMCQGISMGDMWQTPLWQLDAEWDPQKHPICEPLLKGGPAELARRYEVKLPGKYVDECHFCFNVRKALLDRFPEYLAPRQVYGLERS